VVLIRFLALEKKTKSHGGDDNDVAWTEDFLCLYFGKAPILISTNPDGINSINYNFNKIYENLRQVMNNVDPTWLSRIDDKYWNSIEGKISKWSSGKS